MDNKLQKPYATEYILLIASILCQAHNQILLIILLKCKYGYDNKKCETCAIKSKDCKCCFEYINLKGDLVENKCLCCSKNYQKKVDTNLRKRNNKLSNLTNKSNTNFPNIHKFSNHDINKFK